MATSTERYNGWTNWETWNVNLWLTNDEGLYYDARANARRGYQALKDFTEEVVWNQVDCTSGIAYDLLNGALDRVNWDEITDGLTEGDEE